LFTPPCASVGQTVTNAGRFSFSVPRPYATHAPILGRTKLSLPVCSFSTAPPCAGLVPCSEWTKQMSSTHPATCGNSSLTGWPHCPYFLNFHGDLSRLPVLANTTRGR